VWLLAARTRFFGYPTHSRLLARLARVLPRSAHDQDLARPPPQPPQPPVTAAADRRPSKSTLARALLTQVPATALRRHWLQPRSRDQAWNLPSFTYPFPAASACASASAVAGQKRRQFRVRLRSECTRAQLLRLAAPKAQVCSLLRTDLLCQIALLTSYMEQQGDDLSLFKLNS
jgi:hypothetical protein